MGVSENRVPNIATQKFRILIIRTPKLGTPSFRKLAYSSLGVKVGIPREPTQAKALEEPPPQAETREIQGFQDTSSALGL